MKSLKTIINKLVYKLQNHLRFIAFLSPDLPIKPHPLDKAVSQEVAIQAAPRLGAAAKPEVDEETISLSSLKTIVKTRSISFESRSESGDTEVQTVVAPTVVDNTLAARLSRISRPDESTADMLFRARHMDRQIIVVPNERVDFGSRQWKDVAIGHGLGTPKQPADYYYWQAIKDRQTEQAINLTFNEDNLQWVSGYKYPTVIDASANEHIFTWASKYSSTRAYHPLNESFVQLQLAYKVQVEENAKLKLEIGHLHESNIKQTEESIIDYLISLREYGVVVSASIIFLRVLKNYIKIYLATNLYANDEYVKPAEAAVNRWLVKVRQQPKIWRARTYQYITDLKSYVVYNIRRPTYKTQFDVWVDFNFPIPYCPKPRAWFSRPFFTIRSIHSKQLQDSSSSVLTTRQAFGFGSSTCCGKRKPSTRWGRTVVSAVSKFI